MDRKDAELDPEVLSDPLEADDTPTVIDVDAEEAGTGALTKADTRALRSTDPFRLYMAEIKKYPPLSREEEQRLARLYRETGDREALFRLVTANLMLVVRIAFSFRRAAKNLLDLVQEGNVGLLAAIDRFSPEVGVRLPTYAAWWIRAYMVKFLLDNVRLVRVGTTNARRKLLRNLHKEKQKLESMGFDVGPKLLAEHFGVSERDVIDVQAALSSRDVSLDAPVAGSDGDRSHADALPEATDSSVEDEVSRRELQDKMEALLNTFREGLTERELALLDERIVSDTPVSLQALGDRFGTSREAVRQAEGRLMKKLEDFLRQELGDIGDWSLR
ncbi:MAG: sigma-70 family RNA polymerase sigma factor [Acidobacteria bacterium]|nr:sigma-70 family RNA polymerase sigma factor [Acidobacteriota bacterium]NIM61638.1 sigma-70 family RNA polymerase sigma factor [Acidobacteriota bacterium]NIO58169.1 sigma-70 family RNA polymerase sigma factor [Acidobacteriota bacterium]NIQ29182.1 sigma-70 family RNA polymerase sigma factor [Acidobacteriota bacterium]NIQ83726.1 sigma-70 family RNA polymerase sigma factor [Acidobacteriota bacterium]